MRPADPSAPRASGCRSPRKSHRFSSTTAGSIPVGGGIRGQVEGVVIDQHGTRELPFSDNLFPGGTGKDTLGLSTGNHGRWNATLNVGAAF